LTKEEPEVLSISRQRNGFVVSVALVTGLVIYAVISAGVVQASAFVPVFLGMYLLERKRNG
jgi:hypothetical protein